MQTSEWEEYVSVLPMLPGGAHELVKITMDPHVAPNRLAAAAAKDPVLAARVIRVANSVYSAPAVEIVSVFEATVRLGTSEVRRILAAACMTSMMADRHLYGPQGRDLFEHSLGTAYLAWLIADAAGVWPDEAFVCGLLHDIGKLVILKLAKTWRPGVARPEPYELSTCLAERHAEFAGHLVRLQRLPMHLHDPVSWHHAPELAADPRRARVVYAADRLAHRYGFGCAVECFDPLADELLVRAGLNPESLARIDKHAPGLFDVARRALA